MSKSRPKTAAAVVAMFATAELAYREGFVTVCILANSLDSQDFSGLSAHHFHTTHVQGIFLIYLHFRHMWYAELCFLDQAGCLFESRQ